MEAKSSSEQHEAIGNDRLGGTGSSSDTSIGGFRLKNRVVPDSGFFQRIRPCEN